MQMMRKKFRLMQIGEHGRHRKLHQCRRTLSIIKRGLQHRAYGCKMGLYPKTTSLIVQNKRGMTQLQSLTKPVQTQKSLRLFPAASPLLNEEITIIVGLHNQGVQFGLSAQGEEIMQILLADPVPRSQLTGFLFSALRPLLATIGPWNHGYGMRTEHMQVVVQVTQGEEGLNFHQVMQTSTIPSARSMVLIEDITDQNENNLQYSERTRTDNSVSNCANTLLLPAPPLESSAAEDIMAIPVPSLETAVPITSTILTPTATLSEPEIAILPLAQHTETFDEPAQGSTQIDLPPTSHKGKTPAPLDCSNLRRSTRSNKYDGFKINQPIDSRQHKSKVKNRVVPSAGPAHAQAQTASEEMTEETPPPTTVPVLQAVGIQLCAVPEDELIVEALLKAPEGSSSSSA